MSWRKILLSVKLLSHSHDLVEIAQALQGEGIFVCPNPTVADDTRLILGETREVLTISKFMSNLLERAECPQKIVRKSELMLELATIWKKYDRDFSVELFAQAFNLFTELRGFSLQKDLFEQVFEQLDSRLSKSIQVFWAYCEALDIIDEHRAYDWISDWLQASDKALEKEFPSVIFCGFTHLNGNQVDFIKNLSLRTQVLIPFPEKVYYESSAQDYIQWFDKDEDEEKKVNNDEGVQETTRPELKVFRFPEGRMNEALGMYQKQRSSLKGLDVALLTKNLNKRFVLEIPGHEHFYKAQADIFEQDWHAVSDKLTREFWDESQKMSFLGLKEFVQDHMTRELRAPFDSKNFRLIKVWSELARLIENYEGLSELNKDFKLYDIKIILEVLRLNLPRVYTVPLLKNAGEDGASIKGIEGLYRGASERGLLICAQGEYPPLKSGRSSFSQEVLKILSGIGPVKRAELELLMVESRLHECLAQEGTVLFLERGLEESDPAWNEILQKYDAEFIDLIPDQKEKKTDFFKGLPSGIELQNLSATRLQSYIDCPRKFYYQYIEGVSSRESLESELRADQLGTLEHSLIEKYAQDEPEWDEEKHSSYVFEALNQFLTKEQKRISSSRYEEYFNELKTYSKNGLHLYYTLKEWMPKSDFSFEKKVLHHEMGLERRGSIDLLVKTPLGYGLVDFKRSGGSIPTQKAVLEFEKIQLWFYLQALKIKSDDFYFSGFFNLSEPGESLFMCADAETKKSLSELGVKTFVSKDFSKDFEEYKNFEAQKVTELSQDHDFVARPQKPDVCRFCDLSNACPRGEA